MFFLVGICPITERFCALDNFTHGGQDSELTVLLLIALIALVLLFALRRRANLNDASALWRALFAVRLNLLLRRSVCARKGPTAWAAVKKKPDTLIAFPLPLRV